MQHIEYIEYDLIRRRERRQRVKLYRCDVVRRRPIRYIPGGVRLAEASKRHAQ